MSLLIADLPTDERPRERLIRHGPHVLSDPELISILIGTGTRGKSAITLARDILSDGLHQLARKEWSTVRRHGIGAAKAARLAAALELGRRLALLTDTELDTVRDPDRLARQLTARYCHHVQERLGAVYLDAKNRPIREREIYVGTLNATTVSTRDIFRHALEDGAASVIIFHNHPSGDPAPSAEDLIFTKKVVEAGKLLGVDVVDHLILGMNRYVSLKDRGAM